MKKLNLSMSSAIAMTALLGLAACGFGQKSNSNFKIYDSHYANFASISEDEFVDQGLTTLTRASKYRFPIFERINSNSELVNTHQYILSTKLWFEIDFPKAAAETDLTLLPIGNQSVLVEEKSVLQPMYKNEKEFLELGDNNFLAPISDDPLLSFKVLTCFEFYRASDRKFLSSQCNFNVPMNRKLNDNRIVMLGDYYSARQSFELKKSNFCLVGSDNIGRRSVLVAFNSGEDNSPLDSLAGRLWAAHSDEIDVSKLLKDKFTAKTFDGMLECGAIKGSGSKVQYRCEVLVPEVIEDASCK